MKHKQKSYYPAAVKQILFGFENCVFIVTTAFYTQNTKTKKKGHCHNLLKKIQLNIYANTLGVCKCGFGLPLNIHDSALKQVPLVQQKGKVQPVF